MSRPLVTVVVPGFDVADFAAEAVASLEAQEMPAWRAILVDDASRDATGAIFDEAAARDARFTVIRHARRQGLGAARNAGIDAVRTPFLAFLDADDRMTPSALRRWIETLERTGSDLVVGAYVRLRPTAAGGYTPGTVQPWVARSTVPAREAVSLREHPDVSGNIVAWSKASRTDLWHRTGIRFPVGRAYEDQVVAQQLYTRARTIDAIPDVVVEWRERADGSSITQRKDALPILRDYLDALGGGLDVLASAGQTAAIRARVDLIRELDLPPLIEIARIHPDDAYRRHLGTFVRALDDRMAVPRSTDAARERALDAARLW